MSVWLSIVIPVYNVERYIRKCLDSIVAGYRDFLGSLEVIVIDDGSTDGAGQIADGYAARYAQIKVIHQANQGVAAARNAGLAAAHGRWIFFMDPDDWLAEGALGRICRKCGLYPDADILLFDAYQDRAGDARAWEHFHKEHIWTDRRALARLQRGVLYPPMAHADTGHPLAAAWDKVYRRDFLAGNALLFDEQLKVLDDMIFNMEAFGSAAKVAYCKEKIYHYRYVPDSITNSYRPDRVEQDRAVWDHIMQYMGSQADLPDRELFLQAFYCRVIKSFAICCRTCFFHIKNASSLEEQIAAVRAVMATEPYRTAFYAVRLGNAQWRLKVMVLVCRLGWGRGVWLLHKAQCALAHDRTVRGRI